MPATATATSTDRVSVQRQPLSIPTYGLPPADAYPVFFERRVYQGSSGRVYPLPIYSTVAEEPTDHAWDHVTIDNGLVSVELLPEIGGRIHTATDLANGQDLFYRQPVIKPALVGLAGPWISGGVEFNWPQHHRPTTYMPADCTVEHHDDGSATVWMGEHEAMDRMKELHGIRLRPGSSRIEMHVTLTNRTPVRQSFLWWANVAVEVHEQYQSVFPPDVNYVADHAVRAMSSFPVARNHYYGIDYREGTDHPDGGTDLTWYRNIPVPTSYMVLESNYNFLGGYDHGADAGFVFVADRHIAPGKKQWTWGNEEFGQAWDRELTDARDDGSYPPYIELMAGVYTNNQPDFSYLAAYETRSFSYCWWPIRELGPVQQASEQAALRLVVEGDSIQYGVAASEELSDASLVLACGDQQVAEVTVDLQPSEGRRFEAKMPAGAMPEQLKLTLSHQGRVVLTYRPPAPVDQDVPPAAKAPTQPSEVESVEDLVLIAEHLEQYRHPTRQPEPYWEEALRRDPGESRAHVAAARRLMKRGLYGDAIEHLEAARKRLTKWHPNTETGEVWYLLGLCRREVGEFDTADAMFAKSAWDAAYVSAALYQRASMAIACHGTGCPQALSWLGRLVDEYPLHLQGRCLLASMLRHRGNPSGARELAAAVVAKDPLNFRAISELVLLEEGVAANEARDEMLVKMGDASQTLLDVACEFADAGLDGDALRVLGWIDEPNTPMVPLTRWWLATRSGNTELADQEAARSADTARADLFPVRPEELSVLLAASETLDLAEPPYLLGCMLYDRRRYDEAIERWQQCVSQDPNHPGAHRNLGLALFNQQDQPDEALKHYQAAFDARPDDARLLYELDQLQTRRRVDPSDRLKALDRHASLVASRQDLTLERVLLLLLLGREPDALEVLSGRSFHPWEGGEGVAMSAHVAAQLGLGVKAAEAGDLAKASEHFTLALTSPANLGEAKHRLAAQADIHAHLGWACRLAGDEPAATQWFESAASAEQDFADMAVQAFSPMTFFKAWSLRQLGRNDEARSIFEQLLAHGETLTQTPATIDYFATSLPTLFVLDEDLDRRQHIAGKHMRALALRGLSREDEAKAAWRDLINDEPAHLGARQMLNWHHFT